jgi:hypothetical protein
VFPGEGGTVFVMDVNSNVNGLHSEPGFHPEARYEFKVHVDGADIETLTYPGVLGPGAGGPDQRDQLYQVARDHWPFLAGYEQQTSRPFPVIRLTPGGAHRTGESNRPLVMAAAQAAERDLPSSAPQ